MSFRSPVVDIVTGAAKNSGVCEIDSGAVRQLTSNKGSILSNWPLVTDTAFLFSIEAT